MRDPRKAFDNKLVELGEANEKIYAVSCDSASGGGLSGFFAKYPERSVEIGISEQTGVCISAALSKQGMIPVLVIINPFLTMRAYEQIRDDLGYANTNVKIVGSGGGLAYSTLGSTHIAIEDIALMRTIPNLEIFAPGDAGEVEFALEQAVRIDGPVYIRMPRQARNEHKPIKERNLAAGKAEVVRQGAGAALFVYGPSVEEGMVAAKLLAEQGIDLAVVNFPTLKPIDKDAVIAYTKNTKAVFTLEEHIPTGGLGSIIAEIMAQNAIGVPLHMFAVPEGAKQTGPYNELLEYYGLSGQRVAVGIAEVLKRL